MFFVSKEWVWEHRTKKNSFKRKQLEALGISWPPKNGWLQTVDKKIISEENRLLFEQSK